MISCPSGQSQFVIMAKKNVIRITSMQMHRPAKAIPIHLAVGTLSRLHPSAVTEGLETVFPNIEEVILIDIALREAAVDVGTSGNGAVNEDGANGDARTAKIEPVSDLALVGTNIGLTTKLAVYFPFLSGGNNEIHQLAELFITELQAVVSGGTPNRVYGEQAPSLDLMFNKQLFHRLQLTEVHRADTGNDVVCGQTFFIGNHVNRSQSMIKATLTLSEGIMRVA